MTLADAQKVAEIVTDGGHCGQCLRAMVANCKFSWPQFHWKVSDGVCAVNHAKAQTGYGICIIHQVGLDQCEAMHAV